MRQKHADLIHAWAEGAKIQRLQRNGEWKDVLSPAFLPHFSYRIKPTPKPDVVRYANLGLSNAYSGVAVRARRANCSLTFSGETGELIKAEVLK